MFFATYFFHSTSFKNLFIYSLLAALALFAAVCRLNCGTRHRPSLVVVHRLLMLQKTGSRV